MTQVSGRLWECSATLKIFKPHLLTSSRSYKTAEKKLSPTQRLAVTSPCLHTAAGPAGYLGQQLLLVRLDSKTVGGTSRDAGRVVDLPHPTDLSHHPTLLLLLLLLALPPLPFPQLGNWTRNLQLILFVCVKTKIKREQKFQKSRSNRSYS